MNEKKQEYRIGPGASSLLMIFVALCLTSVAILSLASAMADSNMTNKSQQMIDSYYAAAARVQREISGIDAQLLQFRQTSPDKASYTDKVFAIHNDEIGLTVEEGDNSNTALLSFSAPMYGGHEIFVRLNIPLVNSGPRYFVTAHMVQNVSVWTPDDSMSLFQESMMGLMDSELDEEDVQEDDEVVEDDDEVIEDDEDPEEPQEIGTGAEMTEQE